jgi:hypothetical protein
MIEIDENELYYFTAYSEEKYHTLFMSCLRRDIINAFEEVDGVSRFAQIKLRIGENLFISNIGAPVYLLNYRNDDIFEFAGDNQELELFPSGSIPENLDMETVIDFPSYFTKGVEPLIEFKLFNKFWAQDNGVWVPLNI